MIELWNMVSVDGTYSSAELTRVMRSGAFNSKVPFIIDGSKSIRNGKERAQ